MLFVDASTQFDAATQALMVAAAVEYRQVEKNTPPVSSLIASPYDPAAPLLTNIHRTLRLILLL
jgi:hypothetical protein